MIFDGGYECLKCGNQYTIRKDNEDIDNAVTFTAARCPKCGHIGAKPWDQKS